MKYSHYSFDLWRTLIKGNPEFKEKLVILIKEYLNVEGFSLKNVADIIKQVLIYTYKPVIIPFLFVLIFNVILGIEFY